MIGTKIYGKNTKKGSLSAKFRLGPAGKYACSMCLDEIAKLERMASKEMEGKVIVIRPTYNASGCFEAFHLEVIKDPAE